MRQEEEMIQQGEDYRETSPRFADSERGKERSHCTTEIPKSRREDIRQQRDGGGGGAERQLEARRRVMTYDKTMCGGSRRRRVWCTINRK
jgi:hypothetical protein